MDLPVRKPNRLPRFDYSSHGAYFVTICSDGRKNTLCAIVGDGSPVPKPLGQLAEKWLLQVPQKYGCVRIDKYVIMPNHIHILLRIDRVGGTGDPSPTPWNGADNGGTGDPSPTLGNIIGWYKYQVTKEANLERNTAGIRIFQRSYHDHVIRGEKDYLKIWEYIDNNPVRWKEDCFYSEET